MRARLPPVTRNSGRGPRGTRPWKVRRQKEESNRGEGSCHVKLIPRLRAPARALDESGAGSRGCVLPDRFFGAIIVSSRIPRYIRACRRCDATRAGTIRCSKRCGTVRQLARGIQLVNNLSIAVNVDLRASEGASRGVVTFDRPVRGALARVNLPHAIRKPRVHEAPSKEETRGRRREPGRRGG